MIPPIVVIGAGVDGLVAAHYLARRGRRVVVIERRAEDASWSTRGWVWPRITRDLALDRHGLQVHQPDPWIVAPLPEGGRLELWRDPVRSGEAIRRVSPRDATRWPEFCRRMAQLRAVLERLYAAPPPDVMTNDPGELLSLGALGWQLRKMGREGITDLLRVLPMSVAELLDDWFESDVLKGVLGAAGVMHLRQGPRGGGTAFLLLHHHVGNPPGVFRPPRSNVAAVLRGLPGVEIRAGTEVTRILVLAGAVTGVALASGDEIAAAQVVSGLAPRRTLLDLTDPAWLDPGDVHAVRHIKANGVAGRVSLWLNRAPDFTALTVAPSLDYLERAYDDAKHGRVSRQPYIEARCDGQSRMEVLVQYVPYGVDGSNLKDRVLALLSEHWGDARPQHSELAMPRELEEFEGWPEGQPHHAELSLDQALWMRPLPELAHYRTPIQGLWLCGPAMHPGAGIAGAAGLHCAREILGR